MNDAASHRDALDLLRANSQLARQIREIHDHVVAIEARHGLTATNRYRDMSHEFQSVAASRGDVATSRALNGRLRKDLSDHRAYLVRLKDQVRRNDPSNARPTG